MLDTVNNVLVLNYVFCIGCESFVHFNGKSTTMMLRHERKCSAKHASGQNKRPMIAFKAENLIPLRDAAAKFVCLDFRPAYGVRGKGITEYLYAAIQLSKLYPTMTMQNLIRAMPSRNTVTSHIQKLADESVKIVTEMLRTAIFDYGGFGVTCDLWTEKLNATAFIAITVHFFVQASSRLKLKSLVIDLSEMTCSSMTGSNIKQAIIDIFAPFGITEDDLAQHAYFVTDRGSNIRLAVKDFQNHACLAHLCNSVVGAMLETPEAKKIVASASSLVSYVKRSHIASQLSSKLKAHVETRWNSVHDMIDSIIVNYEDLYHLLETKQGSSSRPSNALDKITCLSVSELKAIRHLLAFFKEVTVIVEGDKIVTIHNYWITLREMKKKLQPNRGDTELQKIMRNAGLRYIERGESAGSFIPAFRHKMAVFLHPLMKGLSFAKADDKKEIHEHARSMIELETEIAVAAAANVQSQPSTLSTGSNSLFQDVH